MNDRLLPELLPADLFATPPRSHGTRFVSDVLHAKTFHWGLIVHPFSNGLELDYEIMESVVGKGIAVGLLSKMYADVPIRIYRVDTLSRPDEGEVERVADSYGRTFYGFTALPGIAVWWLNFNVIRLIDAQPPAFDFNSAICTAFVTMVWRDLGVELVPQYAYPTPDMLEKSQNLECIYSEF